MNSTDTIEPGHRADAVETPGAGYAGKAIRLERRIGWILWGGLLVLLILIST